MLTLVRYFQIRNKYKRNIYIYKDINMLRERVLEGFKSVAVNPVSSGTSQPPPRRLALDIIVSII